MARANDGEGGTREETEDRVLEGPSLGTSHSTLSDRQNGNSPLPVLGQWGHPGCHTYPSIVRASDRDGCL